MKLTVSRSEVLKSLELVRGAVDKRTTIPKLGYVLLRTDEDGLMISGTDLDLSIRTRCKANVKAQGGVLVNFRKLHDVVSNLYSDDMHFSSDDNSRFTLTCGKGTYKFAGLPVKELEFPQFDNFPSTMLRVPGDVFQECFEQVSFAALTGPSSHNPSLKGVLIETGNENTLRMVATDGYRLAFSEKRQIDAPAWHSDIAKVVPLHALYKCCKSIQGQLVEIGFDENCFYFRSGMNEIVSRLIAYNYPNYRVLVDFSLRGVENGATTVTLNGRSVANVLRCLLVLVRKENYHPMDVYVRNDSVKFTCVGTESDEQATECVPVVAFEGKPITFRVSCLYMLEFFEAFEDRNVVLLIPSDDHLKARSALVLKLKDDDEVAGVLENYIYIIAPQRRESK